MEYEFDHFLLGWGLGTRIIVNANQRTENGWCCSSYMYTLTVCISLKGALYLMCTLHSNGYASDSYAARSIISVINYSNNVDIKIRAESKKKCGQKLTSYPTKYFIDDIIHSIVFSLGPRPKPTPAWIASYHTRGYWKRSALGLVWVWDRDYTVSVCE